MAGCDILERLELPANSFPLNNAQQTLNNLLRKAKLSDQAALIQARDPHTGSFFTVKPTGSTELSDEAFSTALRLLLELSMYLWPILRARKKVC